MSGPTIGRNSGPYVAPNLEVKTDSIAHHVEKAAEVNETVVAAEDTFWTGMGAVEYAGKAAKALNAGNEARLAGGVAGALAEAVHPSPGQASSLLKTAAGAIGEHAEKIVGVVDKVLESPIGRMAEKGLVVAGVASVAYAGYKGVTDETFQTTGGKVVNGLAAAGVGAAAFISGPVGLAVMGTEVVTGGGVSGTVKGMVAMGEGMWTGDHKALEHWKKDAKSGEHGWLVKAVANNETASKVANVAGTAVVGTAVVVGKAVTAGVKAEVQAVKDVAHAAAKAGSWVSDSVSHGWSALTHAW
jgi:hypothetical protein